MKPLLKYITSLLLFALPVTANAQDTISVAPAKLAIDIYADYGKGLESLFQKQTKWEFGLGLVLKDKYNFVGEYGYGSLNPESVINNGTYTSEGNYYRGGFEYIFRVSPKRSLSAGLMYANASFADNGSVQIVNDLWGDIEETFQRENLSASWAEVILNTQGPVSNAEKGLLNNFYWGVRFRLRILITDISQPNFDIYAIPGYGRTYSNVVPAANLFLKYRFQF